MTTFDRLAVPSVTETPSPSQTFVRDITVSGSSEGPTDGWEVLASATLVTHEAADEVTELELEASPAVRWVKLELGGGIEDGAEFLEFSEIIGNGTQEEIELVERFTGVWDTYLPDTPERSSGLIELKQDGASVTGCYENADITGTVSGNLLRAQGVGRDDGTPSAYVISITEDGLLQGVYSSNGGPFGYFPGRAAPDGTTTSCSDVVPPENPLGCGAVVYGINFDVDSAVLRPDSEPVLQQLFEGLEADDAAAISIEGHTSTEGTDEYNQDLSERRAQSVVDDLVSRGIDASRISAVGRGESAPLFSPEADETERTLNRRVEIVC